VKGLCGHHPELLRLLLREATGEAWSRPLRVRRLRNSFQLGWLRTRCFAVGLNVVRFGGPAEQRGPPVGGGASPAICIGPAVAGGSAGMDSGDSDGDRSGGHFESLISDFLL